MLDGGFRFAVLLALATAGAAVALALAYDLPLRDPDDVAGPTYLRLPLILLLAFLADLVPRTLRRSWRLRSLRTLPRQAVAVVRERWDLPRARFALLGLGAWYLTYAAFRNLKSFVPFVNGHTWDEAMARADAALWFGHHPAEILHTLLGTTLAAQVLSLVYIVWIVLVPASLVVALVWSRDARAGAWYVSAVAVDWVLGAATYFALPTVGPVYARPELFADLDHTPVTDIQVAMMQDRQDVLANPQGTEAVQTIAAFASLHVGICVTACIIAELLRLRRSVRWSLWAFLVLTALATVYLGWHYSLDVLGGAALGTVAVWVTARATGNSFTRRASPGERAHPAVA